MMSGEDTSQGNRIAKIVTKLDYDPWGLRLKGLDYYTNSQTFNKFKTFSGKQLHDDFGFNLLSYKFRSHDPALGRFISIDPLAEKMRKWSPFSYGFDNPLRFIDPDGMAAMDVRPNEKALEAIRNGLSANDAKLVKLDSKGLIDKKLINSKSSESGNFNALKQLVNDTKVYDIKVTDKFDYKSEDGSTKNVSMGDVAYKDFVTGEPLDKPEGQLGYTLTPEAGTGAFTSTDKEVKVIINSNLTPLDQSKNIAHEAYGHAYLYSKGVPYAHKVENVNGQFKDTNTILKNQIKDRQNETEKNFKKGN
jgi:RHS repeat-associated protein